MLDLAQGLTGAAFWLPLIFMLVMGLAMLAYVVLDGYDLGVGVLLRGASDNEKDLMIGSIGPFWDANETWLVLGIGILLVAFPMAHGVILGALYLPVAFMLIGLTLRGVAFDFRAKAHVQHKHAWNMAFFAGSLLAAFSQGYMLGLWITGFATGLWPHAFAVLIGVCLIAAYALMGACWLVIKTEGELQLRAVQWAKASLWLTALGVLAVSVATPLVSERIFARWFNVENLMMLWPIPLMTAVLFFSIARSLQRLPTRLKDGNEYGAWVPFACTIGIFALAFHGLAYSTYPYLVIDRLTIWQSASSPEALKIILVGALIVLPVIVAYTAFAYRVFRGKAQPLSY
jgi:cytochrome bd ubiquinol oxidase subunit II